MDRYQRQMWNQKSSKITTGTGEPDSSEGSNGSITIRDINGQVSLFAKVGGMWHGTDLGPTETLGERHLTHLTIDDSGINAMDGHTSLAHFGETLRIGEDSSSKSALRVASDGSMTIGTSGTTNFSVSNTGTITSNSNLALTGASTKITIHASDDTVSYDQASAIFLGLDSSTPKLSIKGSSGTALTWDGSALTVSGAITCGSGSTFSGRTWNGAAIDTAQLADDAVESAKIANGHITDALLDYSAKDWTTNLEITGTAYNNLLWNNGSSTTNATITFADGTTQTINHGNKTSGLSDNTTYFAYATEGSSTLDFDSDYTVAIGANKILLATIVVTTAAGGGAPSIFPYRTNSLTISAASIAANAITATAIAADTITANEIDGNTITANEIAGTTITAAEIAGTTITAAKMASDVISGGKIIAGLLTASNLETGNLQTNKLNFASAGGNVYLTNSTPSSFPSSDCVYVGYNAGENTAAGGNDNVAVGDHALNANTGGQRNICIGSDAGKLIDDGDGTGGYGDENICIGYEAGDNLTTGRGNVFIGTGNFGSVTGSNQLVIASGNTGTGTGSTLTWLTGADDGDIAGTHGTYHTSSDERLKQDVVEISNALTKINSIRGVKFNWKDSIKRESCGLQVGVIAQEIEAILPEAVHTAGSGMKSVLDGNQLSGLLIQAIKELSAKIDTMQTEINNLKG